MRDVARNGFLFLFYGHSPFAPVQLVQSSMGLRQEALSTLESCYEIRLAVLGKVHADALAPLNNSAYVLERMGQHADALERYRRCLEIAIQLHGDRHVEVADAQQSIAVRLVPSRQRHVCVRFPTRLDTGHRSVCMSVYVWVCLCVICVYDCVWACVCDCV